MAFRNIVFLPILFSIVILTFIGTSAAEELADELFFSFQLNDIRGKPVDFEQFRGKTTLLVNTASQCSQTESHMKSLKRLHDILSHGNVFTVIAFPCNEFGEQEPWDNQEIEEYYRGHFFVEFIILEKGSMQSDLWKWIKGKSVAPSWNFHKYLIDGRGKIVKNWPGDTSVESIFESVQTAISLEEGMKGEGEDVSLEEEDENLHAKGEDGDLLEEVQVGKGSSVNAIPKTNDKEEL